MQQQSMQKKTNNAIIEHVFVVMVMTRVIT